MPRRFPDGLPAVLPATIARIERRLPSEGEILVRLGSHVEPDDLIGQCSIQGDPVALDVAGALGIEPRDLRRRMRRQPGDEIAFHDILAGRRSWSFLAPFSGTLAAVDETTGFVVLVPAPIPASVTAMIRGQVVALEPARSATIGTVAAVVQGAVGFGGEQWGVLHLLTTDPAAIITPEMIDAESAFTLVAGGAGITADALRKAQEEQVKGVIVGGIDAGELRDFWGGHFDGNWSQVLQMGGPIPMADDAPTILITEGFGHHPISRPIFDVLAQLDGLEAHLDGTTRLATPQSRPRMVVPLAESPEVIAGTAPPSRLQAGTLVRLLDEAHLGSIGRVESVHAQARLPSGVRTATAVVQIDEGERVVLPQLALEVIG